MLGEHFIRRSAVRPDGSLVNIFLSVSVAIGRWRPGIGLDREGDINTNTPEAIDIMAAAERLHTSLKQKAATYGTLLVTLAVCVLNFLLTCSLMRQ